MNDKKPAKTAFDYNAFAKEWNAAPSVAAVAKKFRLSRRQATMLASALRRKGIELVRFTVHGPRIDYTRLRDATSSGRARRPR